MSSNLVISKKVFRWMLCRMLESKCRMLGYLHNYSHYLILMVRRVQNSNILLSLNCIMSRGGDEECFFMSWLWCQMAASIIMT